jgi:hypothetical protein
VDVMETFLNHYKSRSNDNELLKRKSDGAILSILSIFDDFRRPLTSLSTSATFDDFGDFII